MMEILKTSVAKV